MQDIGAAQRQPSLPVVTSDNEQHSLIEYFSSAVRSRVSVLKHSLWCLECCPGSLPSHALPGHHHRCQGQPQQRGPPIKVGGWPEQGESEEGRGMSEVGWGVFWHERHLLGCYAL